VKVRKQNQKANKKSKRSKNIKTPSNNLQNRNTKRNWSQRNKRIFFYMLYKENTEIGNK
jgi:hypothetical protein